MRILLFLALVAGCGINDPIIPEPREGLGDLWTAEQLDVFYEEISTRGEGFGWLEPKVEYMQYCVSYAIEPLMPFESWQEYPQNFEMLIDQLIWHCSEKYRREELNS